MKRKTYKNNTSGFTGVHYDRYDGRWMARKTINGKTHFLGYYESPKEADEAIKNFLKRKDNK